MWCTLESLSSGTSWRSELGVVRSARWHASYSVSIICWSLLRNANTVMTQNTDRTVATGKTFAWAADALSEGEGTTWFQTIRCFITEGGDSGV